jgi:hypothetical protein
MHGPRVTILSLPARSLLVLCSFSARSLKLDGRWVMTSTCGRTPLFALRSSLFALRKSRLDPHARPVLCSFARWERD